MAFLKVPVGTVHVRNTWLVSACACLQAVHEALSLADQRRRLEQARRGRVLAYRPEPADGCTGYSSIKEEDDKGEGGLGRCPNP